MLCADGALQFAWTSLISLSLDDMNRVRECLNGPCPRISRDPAIRDSLELVRALENVKSFLVVGPVGICIRFIPPYCAYAVGMWGGRSIFVKATQRTPTGMFALTLTDDNLRAVARLMAKEVRDDLFSEAAARLDGGSAMVKGLHQILEPFTKTHEILFVRSRVTKADLMLKGAEPQVPPSSLPHGHHLG